MSGLRLGLGLTGSRSRVLRAFDFATAARSAGAFTLPPWLAIACATTGRTVQESASTVRTGLGANVARARSVDGSSWGLSVEAARTNLVGTIAAADGTVTWTATGQADPAGGTSGARLQYSGAGSLGGARVFESLGTSGNGTRYSVSTWWRVLSGFNKLSLDENLGGAAPASTTIGAAWQRNDAGGTGDGATGLILVVYGDTVSNAAVDAGFFGTRVEAGAYPSSVHAGVRAADVLSIPTPALVAPGGFFDLRLTFAPNYAHGEHLNDHDLFYLGANDRVFLRASDHKLVLRIGGANVESSALTWSREQALTIRAAHLPATRSPAGRTLTVTGANSGNGSTTGAVAAAVTLPGTAYLLGSNTGPQECSDLRRVDFY